MSTFAEDPTLGRNSDQRNMGPDCGSHSNTESDRDANNDEASSKRAEGSSDEEPAAGEGLSEEVYEVEKILDHDETKEGLFYLVHWKGFGEEDDSWEPAENLAFATKAIKDYEERRKAKSKKSSSKKSKTSKSKNKSKEKETKKSSLSKSQQAKSSSSKKSGHQRKGSGSDNSESEPEVPSVDEDSDFSEREKSKKKSAPTPSYSGTVTKAALKSYSPTTTRSSRNSLGTPIRTVETMSAAKKALQMRQSWLYDSDSDDDSGTEKENEKKKEDNKIDEDEKVEAVRGGEEKSRKQRDETQKLEEPPRNDRKRKGEDGSGEKKKKAKAESHAQNTPDTLNTSVDLGSGTSSERAENGSQTGSNGCCSGSSAAPSTSDVHCQDKPEIFAVAQDREGQIRVLVGIDGVKKVVSLRDAHDVNSWGLVQHILKYARFSNYE